MAHEPRGSWRRRPTSAARTMRQGVAHMSVLKNRGRRHAFAVVTVAGAVTMAGLGVHGQGKPACDPDNGGIKLPTGFCAQVVANNLGVARQMAVAPNGDL